MEQILQEQALLEVEMVLQGQELLAAELPEVRRMETELLEILVEQAVELLEIHRLPRRGMRVVHKRK